jgi:ComF family protein
VGCEEDFFPPQAPRCTRRAIRLSGATAICGHCLTQAPHFDGTSALSDYEAPVAGMIGALKFSARLDVAEVFARLLAAREPQGERADMVVAVPLSHERERERGFNQSREIGRRYAWRIGLPFVENILLRVRHSAPQQALAREARRRNVKGTFAVVGEVRGRSVVVVDDVMTTGSTLDEIAVVLTHAGAARVFNRVVARTP